MFSFIRVALVKVSLHGNRTVPRTIFNNIIKTKISFLGISLYSILDISVYSIPGHFSIEKIFYYLNLISVSEA